MPNAVSYRPIFQAACERLKGPDYCSPTVVQGLMAVSRHETCLGECKPFIGTHNYGAIQCGVVADKHGKCPDACIPARDTSPTSAGTSIAYLGCFEVKPSVEAGVARFVKLMTVDRPKIAAALPSGDAREIAWGMRRSYYFEGFGKTQEERVENYAKAIKVNADRNAAQLGTATLIEMPPPEPPLDPPLTAEEAAGVSAAAIFAGLIARITRGSRSSETP